MKTSSLGLFFNLDDDKNYTSLAGKFLVASPYGSFNDVFNKSVIYLASHTKQGAIGLIINHLINKMSIRSLLNILKDDNNIKEINIPVFLGGPMEAEKGFILHSMDYKKNILFNLNDKLGLSSNIEILKDISNGEGPMSSLFVMGYTGWDSGQLEKEITDNLWIVTESSPKLIFNENNDTKWQIALESTGVNINSFSSQIGQA